MATLKVQNIMLRHDYLYMAAVCKLLGRDATQMALRSTKYNNKTMRYLCWKRAPHTLTMRRHSGVSLWYDASSILVTSYGYLVNRHPID